MTLFAAVLAVFAAANAVSPQPATAYDFPKLKREKLGRGVVAFRSGAREAVVSWRYRMEDPPALAFNVYRGSTRLNASPLAGATFFKDGSFDPAKGAVYSVKPVLRGRESTNPARGWRVPAARTSCFRKTVTWYCGFSRRTSHGGSRRSLMKSQQHWPSSATERAEIYPKG